MIQGIICLAFGFVAGYCFKEIISKPKPKMDDGPLQSSAGRTVNPARREDSNKTNIPNPHRNNQPVGFNLESIAYLFDEYGTPLKDSNSLSNLLKNIEIRTYTDTLQFFANRAIDSKALYNLIESESSKNVLISPVPSTKEIIIPDSMLNQLLSSRKLNGMDNSPREDKMQILVTYAVTKGLKSFKDSLGPSLNDFMERYERGEDVGSIYQEIMENIRATLSYLKH